MKILGKPHKITGIEKSPIYRAAYRACVSAGKNDTKNTAKQYEKIAQFGLEDATKTKLVMKTAKRDYMTDIIHLSSNDRTQISMRELNIVKTNIKLTFNFLYRRSKKALNHALKQQHPKTYKMREKIIDRGSVTIENDTRPFARLGRLNINPLNL